MPTPLVWNLVYRYFCPTKTFSQNGIEKFQILDTYVYIPVVPPTLSWLRLAHNHLYSWYRDQTVNSSLWPNGPLLERPLAKKPSVCTYRWRYLNVLSTFVKCYRCLPRKLSSSFMVISQGVASHQTGCTWSHSGDICSCLFLHSLCVLRVTVILPIRVIEGYLE